MDNMEEKYFLTRGKAILFFLLIIVILIVFIFIKSKGKNSIENYHEFEKELIKGATNYVYMKNLYLDDGEEIKITKNQIFSVYSTDNKLKDKCDGYVIVSSDENIETEDYEINYVSYIKCGSKYVTKNYSEY